MRPAILIGGVASGCGKTTATLGLMAALVQRGLHVQGFKVGPDFIDPGLHAAVTGRPSWNLDGWMGDGRTVHDVFERVMDGRIYPASPSKIDIGVIEGVMGLFDGADPASNAGSSAEIADWLAVPVLLVVDAKGLSRSLGAFVQGFSAMLGRPLDGVIATRVGSANHAALLRETLRHTCPDIPLLAALPVDMALARPSRHLGLISATESPLGVQEREYIGRWFAEHADIEAILDLAGYGGTVEPAVEPEMVCHAGSPTRIAVARDEAFCFLYPSLQDALHRAGAELVFFSPVHDTSIPSCDGVWLPGGYPELHVEALSANTDMVESLRALAAAGVPIHGECGGYVWLAQALLVDGVRYPMGGLLPGTVQLGSRRAELGYRSATLYQPCALGDAGTYTRGHSFHYCAFVDGLDAVYHSEQVRPLWQVADRKGMPLGFEGMVRENVSGTWVHMYPDGNPKIVRNFVRACREHARSVASGGRGE